MKYQYGLSNYILHELGSNLEDNDSAIKNEEKIFKKLNESERIEKEIGKIKKKYKKNKFNDKENTIISNALKSKDNIKEIIVCLDLIMKIEISFKTTFISIVKDILVDEDIISMLDNEELNSDEMDNAIKCSLFDYLDNIVNS